MKKEITSDTLVRLWQIIDQAGYDQCINMAFRSITQKMQIEFIEEMYEEIEESYTKGQCEECEAERYITEGLRDQARKILEITDEDESEKDITV